MKQLIKKKLNSSFFAGAFLGILFGFFGFIISNMSDDNSFQNGALVGSNFMLFLVCASIGIGLFYLIKGIS